MTAPATQDRLIRRLKDAFGSSLCEALSDPDVTEIMLNPDGRLYIERQGRGIDLAGTLEASRAEILIGTVAHVLGREVNETRPIVSGEIPIGGHRFEGLLPPVVQAPAFSIRRRAISRIPLELYVANGAMTADQHAKIHHAILNRQNILVCGGTGSGKTTLANAILLEISRLFPSDRILLIEDTVEIECAAENAVTLRSSDDIAVERLLKSTLRLRPDRIMVGEVRDGSALTLLKAWNTGHPGGFTTLHANDARLALIRLEQLVGEATSLSMQSVIADAIDVVVSMKRGQNGRRVEEVLTVDGVDQGRYRFS